VIDKLSLAEKCFIASLGDVTTEARRRLLSIAELPKSGVLIGGVLSAKFNDGRLTIRVKPSLIETCRRDQKKQTGQYWCHGECID
jgi:hypothetical protein